MPSATTIGPPAPGTGGWRNGRWPRKRRHEIFHKQRGRLLAAVLKARADVVVATLPFHLHE